MSSCAVTRKAHVTDRAKRYRANQPACIPSGPRRCERCHSTRFLTVDHRDGREENGAKSNLRWLCKSCNTRLGAQMAKKGKGRRTQQYNPTKSGGAANLFEYVLAIAQHGSHYDPRLKRRVGDHDAGGAMIHATPKSKRREFASDIWAHRKSHGNPPKSVRVRLRMAGQSGTVAAKVRKIRGGIKISFGKAAL